MQRILSYLRRTIDNYNMIEEGDKIAVGLSGGKDSFTLLMGLKALQRFYPKKFDFKKRKDNTVKSLFEIEHFLRDFKQVAKGIKFYKVFKW